ncbi:hypothetical protein B5807_04715 [Epicoccum nigrum]|uniref:Uncharacterized protein n=1 Tax=Epicoccum nigrum TaxID=105696 RepID=A0A1Y2M5M6_EPING|nr:hypothetical protein B5807_04715 [Epicoccum nigrum]
MASPTSKSPFLDMLPPELRLRVYDHLLVASVPVKGTTARRNTRYGLCTAILRVNRQIHAEARSAFYGRNTFYITSVPGACTSPSSNDDAEQEQHVEEGSGAFEPPLQAHDLPLLRHLQIDPLFYPGKPSAQSAAGKPSCPAAERYVLNLTYLLTLVGPTLRSLSFTADARPYARFGDEGCGVPSSRSPDDNSDNSEDEDEDEDEQEGPDAPLNIPKLLTSFHIIEKHSRFLKAVADLASIRNLSVSFLFPESEFHFDVDKAELCRRGLLFLACQTVFARSEIGIQALLEGLGEEGSDEAEEARRGVE